METFIGKDGKKYKKMFCNSSVCELCSHCFRHLEISSSSDMFVANKKSVCANHIEWTPPVWTEKDLEPGDKLVDGKIIIGKSRFK